MKKSVIVLAGGLGTRLSSVLNGLPKPLAPIGDKPFIYYVLKNLVNEGFTEFYFSLFYESYLIIDYINKLKLDLLNKSNIYFIIEPQQLGTGGAVKYIFKKYNFTDNPIIINADTIIDHGYGKIFNSQKNTIGVINSQDTERFGRVTIGDNNLVLNFEEKVNNKPGYINAGIYNLDKIFFLECNKEIFSLENDILKLLSKDKVLNAEILHTFFIDIGIPKDYNKFCQINNK